MLTQIIEERDSEFDKVIGYCDRNECVDLQEIKSFNRETARQLIEGVKQKVANLENPYNIDSMDTFYRAYEQFRQDLSSFLEQELSKLNK